MFCTECGKQNPDGAKFCINCGRPMPHAEAVSPSTPPSTSRGEPPSEVSRFCALAIAREVLTTGQCETVLQAYRDQGVVPDVDSFIDTVIDNGLCMNRGALEELKGTPMVSDQSAPESIACAQPSEWFPESEKTAARDPYTPSPHTNTPANKGRRWLRGILGAVVGVSAVLLVLYLMTAKELGREEARRINCALNLKQMGLALRMYSSDYGESFPPDWAHLMALDYLTTGRVYTCPSQSTLPPQNAEQLTTGDRCDYLYFGAGLTEECDGHPPAKTILACDKPGNHNGRLVSDGHLNVLFADGSVRGYTGVNSIGQLAERQGLYLLSRP